MTIFINTMPKSKQKTTPQSNYKLLEFLMKEREIHIQKQRDVWKSFTQTFFIAITGILFIITQIPFGKNANTKEIANFVFFLLPSIILAWGTLAFIQYIDLNFRGGYISIIENKAKEIVHNKLASFDQTVGAIIYGSIANWLFRIIIIFPILFIYYFCVYKGSGFILGKPRIFYWILIIYKIAPVLLLNIFFIVLNIPRKKL